MSYNRAPAADLAPWIGRLYATFVEAPDDHRMECGVFNDSSCIRIQLRGDWWAHTVDGDREFGRAALYFGPQTRRMPVAVTGGFISLGLALRPGAGHAVMKTNAADYIDRILPCEEVGLPGQVALDALTPDMAAEDMLQALESFCRHIIEQAGAPEPDPVSTRFEAVAFADPSISINDFARDCGIPQRRLERIIRRDFGLSPKQVLKRSRALDIASHLRGVADAAEAEALELRYYDQSHLIREFTELFDMSPRQFVSRPQPILTLSLESRQARRLEAMKRLAPGEPRPWE